MIGNARTVSKWDYEDADLVAEAQACPKCGNRIQDELVCTDDDTVICAVCGYEYETGEETQC